MTMTPEEAAAWAEKHYRCPNPVHEQCLGPTGTWNAFPCSVCKVAVYRDTCWQRYQRVPSVAPVLCDACADQGVLL